MPPRKVRKRKKKGNGRPDKLPRSAYRVFADQYRDQNPNLDFKELGSITGKAWKELSEKDKQVFIREAAREKILYLKQMALYYAENPESSSDEEVRLRKKRKFRDPDKPKRIFRSLVFP